MNVFFHKVAAHVSKIVGSSYAFLTAVALIVLWLASGPVFGFSDTWQLIINTSTTIVTFLMVFLIQNTQNRDSISLQLKLDELIRATGGARNSMMDLSKLSDDQLHQLELEFERICTQCERPEDERPEDERPENERPENERPEDERPENERPENERLQRSQRERPQRERAYKS
jgi:low affinity Fe/Cu permease